MSIDSMSVAGEVLYSWPVTQGELSLIKGSEGCVALLKKTDGTFHAIDHSLPSPLLTLSERDIVMVYCASTYPQLVELSNSSYRLHLCTRGLGGMMDAQQKASARRMGVQHQSDYQISAAIQRNLENAPGNLYTNVQVERCMHHFNGTGIAHDVPSRHITLQVGYFDSISNYFEKFFQYVLASYPDADTVHRYRRGIINAGITDTILGIRHEDAQYQHIINAFKRNSTIHFWISIDIEYIDIRVDESLKQDDRCIIL